MTKKSTFRKPATDAVIEYLQQHKTATSMAGIFKGYKPTRVTGKGTYHGESWGNVRDGALDPNRPRIRGFS